VETKGSVLYSKKTWMPLESGIRSLSGRVLFMTAGAEAVFLHLIQMVLKKYCNWGVLMTVILKQSKDSLGKSLIISIQFYHYIMFAEKETILYFFNCMAISARPLFRKNGRNLEFLCTLSKKCHSFYLWLKSWYEVAKLFLYIANEKNNCYST